MTGSRLEPDVIRILAEIAELPIAPSSYEALARSLDRYLEAIRSIPLKDMLEVDPGIAFDPQWHAISRDI